MSIKVSGITKLYGEQRALDDVSFKVNTGEVVGFIGPNGAGKSTMMKIITGYIPQSQGEVWVNDINTLENGLEIRRMIGYLPENNPLYVEMYVKEYLTMVANLYLTKGKAGKKPVDDMIEKVGLGPEKHKKIGALSKGFRQRVGLAQALIHDPSVLILDEPTSGLDPNQIVEIRNFIHGLGKKKTILLSTHIMQEVEAICDRVVIINLGKIVADESTAELRKKESSIEKVFAKLTK
jgi:ABC-2 type transport system ATP-binding protein